MRSVARLLVRAPNWLGDTVLSLGALRDVRRNFSGARIEVLARGSVAELYQAVTEVDAVRVCTRFRSDIDSLKGAFDAAVLFPNSFGSALQVFLAGVPERWGYATDGRGFLLTRRARVPAGVRGWSEVYYHRAMLAGIGLTVSASPDCRLACPDGWRGRGDALLGGASDDVWVGLNPGAFFGSAKRWIPERYAAVGDRLARSGVRIAILGGAADRPVGEAIADGMRTRPRVMCGETSLADLVGVLSRLRLLVTNDSGPMHVAAALGTPVVALFGPTDWRETAPIGAGHRLVREDVACAPCKLRECPIDHRCMRRIAADRVAEAALEVLGT